MAAPPVFLFGYKGSTFTMKVRLALRLKQIPYTFITVPSMMPRTILKDNFHLTYRKIPVLALGRDIYCDTSLILEALETFFGEGYPSLYPHAIDGRNYRPLIRGFASFWTDRPLFRVTTGLIPASVWRTEFGRDRAGLIGHPLNADKLEAKLPFNMASFDMHLSILEPLFTAKGSWIFATTSPSAADIALYYQLEWGMEVSQGRHSESLTAGGTADTNIEGASLVFNAARYPKAHAWFTAMEKHMNNLPEVEARATSIENVLLQMSRYQRPSTLPLLLPTQNTSHHELDTKIGLQKGAEVSIVPDDTGRDDPTLGTLIDLSPEEVVITPRPLESPARVRTHIHFPRLGFVVKPVQKAQL